MPNFSSHVENAVNALGVKKMVDENEFIDASRFVYDGFREIRRKAGQRAWLMNILTYLVLQMPGRL